MLWGCQHDVLCSEPAFTSEKHHRKFRDLILCILIYLFFCDSINRQYKQIHVREGLQMSCGFVKSWNDRNSHGPHVFIPDRFQPHNQKRADQSTKFEAQGIICICSCKHWSSLSTVLWPKAVCTNTGFLGTLASPLQFVDIKRVPPTVDFNCDSFRACTLRQTCANTEKTENWYWLLGL